MLKQGVEAVKIVGLVIIVVALSGSAAFAAVGWGENATGGAGGTVVTVSDGPNFLDYISRSGKYVIQVDGNISLSEMHDVESDKTIVGVETDSTISGGGLDIDEVNNVIIKNLRFENSNDDAINLQDGSTNVWIYHCSFDSCHDGQVDIKHASDFVTVSWCHFQNHDHVLLLGHSDDNGDEDTGHLRVTYHHNFFDGTEGRHPRVRFSALCHVYNNYYIYNNYGVASTCDAEVLVEGNYFNYCYAPMYVGYASSPDGDLVERDNLWFNHGVDPETRGTVPEPPYSYILDDAADVPTIVQSYAGADNPEPPHWFFGPYGDFTRNGEVDTDDLEQFAQYWLIDDCEQTVDADYDGDCKVNFYEFALLAENWTGP